MHAPPGTETIESFLREALGRDLLISAYLGPARANRKPVLQLLSSRGQPAGFAKIGTSPLTRALVQAERDALTRLGQAGLTDVTVPRVLHYGEWREMNVLVLSALPDVYKRQASGAVASLASAVTWSTYERPHSCSGSASSAPLSAIPAARLLPASPARASLVLYASSARRSSPSAAVIHSSGESRRSQCVGSFSNAATASFLSLIHI